LRREPTAAIAERSSKRVPRRRAPRPRRPPHDETGQGLIEYGLILAIMAVVCVISLLFFSDQLSTLLSLVASAV
jgi:Flp pilus assembly pilin Flp